nr:phage DNA encapsidation protein [Lachnospiraceae bacterium]
MDKISNDLLYFDGGILLSYVQSLFYFCIGGRGTGKTYWFKRFCIRKFIQKKHRWVYIRRYKSELKMKGSILDDVSNEFPNHKLEVRGFEMFCDGESMGYIVTLSTQKTAKGQVFDNIKNIIYDEFMFETTAFYRYLDNEVEMFMEMFESIARLNDDVRAYFLANSVSIINPYFLYYNIEPELYHDESKMIEHVITKNDINGVQLVTDVYYNEYFKEHKEDTKFGKLVSGTNFGDYLINNKMKTDSSLFIEKRPKICKYMYTICFQGFNIGVWMSPKTRMIHISTNCDPTFHTKYVFYPDDFTGKEIMCKSYKDHQDLKALVW